MKRTYRRVCCVVAFLLILFLLRILLKYADNHNMRLLLQEEAFHYYQLILDDYEGKLDLAIESNIEVQSVARILQAEILQLKRDSAYDKTIIDNAVQWIVDHKDDNADGEVGWGLNFAWDAFSDGSENPKNHVYAIETVNVLNALMDYLECGIASGDTKRECLELISESVNIWNNKYWTEKSGGGKSFIGIVFQNMMQ